MRLIGPSWGGEYAVLYTTRHPENVVRLALLEPGALTEELAHNGEDRDLSLRHAWRFLWAAFETFHLDAPDAHANQDYVFASVALNTNLDYFCNREIPPNYAGHRTGMVAHREIREDILAVNADDGGFDLTVGIDALPHRVLFLAGECDTLLAPKCKSGKWRFFPTQNWLCLKMPATRYLVKTQTRPLMFCAVISRNNT